MSGKKVENIVLNMAQPVVENMGYELTAVEYIKEGSNWFLRIYIDKENGVDIDDCQGVSQKISELLDNNDPIPQSYFLEVSSPGIERILQTDKDFMRFQGENININLYSAIDGRKKYTGKLGPVSTDKMSLVQDDGTIIELPREKIAQVRLAWKE